MIPQLFALRSESNTYNDDGCGKEKIMKLASAAIIAGTILSIGFCIETSRKETAKQLQEFIRFLLFAGQEIETRGSMLKEVFRKAELITQGATKEFVDQIAKRMEECNDFLQEWDYTAREVYSKIGWNTQEQELILHCASDFLLPERGMVREQLLFDAKQLSQLCEKRVNKLGNECKLCRVLSFSAAAFLLILIC